MRRPAGEYKHLIVIKRNTEAPNSSGQLIQTPTVYCERRARILKPSGKELVVKEGLQVQTQYNVVLCVGFDSKTSKIDPTMTVFHDGKRFEIVTARDADGDRDEIQIDCVELPQS